MFSGFIKLIRLASFLICLIVIASFVVFAANQTKSASNHQQEQLGGSTSLPAGLTPAQRSHESSIHEALDEASEELTSPFAGVISGSHSQWVIHTVKMLLALLVYGFGLGYLARALRVRV